MMLISLPPLHPILVNFTAALFPASFLSDVVGRWTRKESLRSAAWWMLLYAAVITPFTAAAGWFWLREMGGMDMDQAEMAFHKWLGTSLSAVFILLAIWRWRIHVSGRVTSIGYLACAALVLAMLTLQGHLGGLITFGAEEEPGNSSTTEDHERSQGHEHQPQTKSIQWQNSLKVDK